MKRSIKFLGAILFSSATLTSCGGGIESDAKKMADLQCKILQLQKELSSGDESVMEEGKGLGSEMIELTTEMKDKYTSDSDQKDFDKAFRKELKNCK